MQDIRQVKLKVKSEKLNLKGDHRHKTEDQRPTQHTRVRLEFRPSGV